MHLLDYLIITILSTFLFGDATKTNLLKKFRVKSSNINLLDNKPHLQINNTEMKDNNNGFNF